MAMKNYLYLLLVVIISLFANTEVKAGLDGIAPNQACQLLDDIGLSTLGWQAYGDNESKCASRSIQIGTGNPFKNALAFHVEGIGQTVHQLKLIISVLNPLEAVKAHVALKEAAQRLIIKITNKPAPESVLTAISDGKNLSLKTGGITVDVSRREWTMNTDWATINCHEIAVSIK